MGIGGRPERFAWLRGLTRWGGAGAVSRRSLSLQLTLAMATTCLIAFVPLGFFAIGGMREIDEAAVARDRALIERAITDQIEAFGQEQRSVTEWDDAVVATAGRDHAWMEENVGVWLHDFHGHDMAFVLDAGDAPIHAMVEGATVAPEAFDGLAPELAPLLAAARAQIAAADADLAQAAAMSAMVLDGSPSLVSVRPIIASSPRVALRPEDAYLHVSVQRFDERFFTDIGARYIIDGIHLEGAAPEQAVFTLEGLGPALGRIAWTPERPGRKLLTAMAPAVVLSILFLLGSASWLLVRLRRAVERMHDSEAHAQHLAMHDVLTGLPNRAMFDARLDEALRQVRAHGGRIALHCIDLDRFKHVNDTLGHPAGDALIHQVAFRLSQVVRARDTVARLGGDEFAIIQTDVREPQDARRLADRVLATIREPFQLNTDTAFVDSSIGTVLAPDFGAHCAELMRKADIALYEAKAQGKGRQCVFELAQDEEVRQKRLIERNLRDDLGRGSGLGVVYQPILRIDGATLVGAEALVRWDHPDHGPLSPALFIPVAEERGLIQGLGAFVLREACIAARELDLPWVAVNVSAVQFRAAGFVDLVLDTLREVALSPERLQLEITEGLLLDATDAVASAMTKLRFAGVCIALDDFGTGYCSLKYLHRYKVDKIKIDQSFVRNLGAEDSTDAIVRAMIDLGRALDLGVTAEGVETEAQWRRLAACGAPELQGYLFSRPISREALATFARGGAARSGVA